MPPSISERAWAAGFFEGEGSIFRKKRKNPNGSIGLQIGQVSLERLERMRDSLGVGRILGPYHYKTRPNNQPFYYWTVSRQADVRLAMDLMWPYLGPTTRKRAASKGFIK